MTPPKRKQISNQKAELRRMKLSLRDMSASKEQLMSQSHDKDLKVLRLEQELQQLKSILARVDVKLLQTALAERKPPAETNYQAYNEMLSGEINAQEHPMPGPARDQIQLLKLQDQRLRTQQVLLEETEKENGILRRACLDSAEEVNNLRVELDRVSQENDIQTSRGEESLLKEALLNQQNGHLNSRLGEQEKELQEMRVSRAKITGFKRKLTEYLNDIEFAEAPPTTIPDHLSLELPATEDIDTYANKEMSTEKFKASRTTPLPTFNSIPNRTKIISLKANYKPEGAEEASSLFSYDPWSTPPRDLAPAPLPGANDNPPFLKEVPAEADESRMEGNDGVESRDNQNDESDDSDSSTPSDGGSDYDPDQNWDAQSDIKW